MSDPREDAARDWWRKQISDDAPDRGVRARLRRCDGARDALAEPAALLLWRRLGADEKSLDRVLGLAIVLAHVREDDRRHPMQAAGWKKFPGQSTEGAASSDIRPVLSELRFRRLLQCTTEPELVDAFRRLVKLLGEQANVGVLAQSLLDWTHPRRGDRVRQDWGLSYFHARDIAPAEEQS